VQFGSIGRGTESEMQHSKATGKGGLDFALALQEQLQAELPAALAFEFEQRDDAGELTATATKQAKSDLVGSMYERGLLVGAPMITREEARQLLAEGGLIPNDWTLTEEDVTSTDTEDAEESDAALESERVQRAMAAHPGEAIVRYRWPQDTMRTLWEPGVHVTKPVLRATEGTRAVLYSKGGVEITEEDVLRAIRNGRDRVGDEFAELLTAPTIEE
jgi:hypothetical protein